MMENLTQIYICLLNEGTDSWCPVQALHVRDDLYKITSSNPYTEDEELEFALGDLVRCKRRVNQDGVYLVAYEKAEAGENG